MTVFLFNMKRILNRKRAILTMFIVPVIVSILVVKVNFNEPRLKVAILDNDNTHFTDIFINNLNNSYKTEKLDKDQISGRIASGQIDYGIIIDQGFTKKVIGKEMPNIKVIYDKKDDICQAISSNISVFMNKANEIASKSNKNYGAFYSKLDKLIAENKFKTLVAESSDRKNIIISLNFLVMLMLYNAINMTNRVMNDKKEKIRTFAAPITIRSYMLQIIFTLFLLELSQVVVVFIALIIEYKFLMIKYIFKLLLLYSTFSITAVSLAVLLNYMNQTYIKKDIVTSILVVPISMLGGCFWNIRFMPRALQFISQFIPISWITNGNYEALEGANYMYLGTDIGILVLFSIVFLLLGVFTKKDIVS